MKLRKIISFVLAAGIATLTCSSCGTGETGEVSISIGDWPAVESSWLTQLNKYKDEFELAYPNIKIEPDTWAFDLKTFYPKAEAGLLPDVYEAAFTEMQKITDGGYAADITEVLKDAGFYDNLNPRLRDEICSVDGKVYAFPASAYALGVNINLKLWKEAGLVESDGTPKQPKTWEELAEFAQIITEKTGKPGFTLCTTNNCGGWFFSNIAWSYGVDFMEQQSDGKWKATFDTQEAVDALQFVKDLKWKYNCVPGNNLIDPEEASKLFATYQTGMVLDTPKTNIGKYDMDLLDYGIIPLPAGPKRHVALLGGKIKAVKSGTTPEEQAAVFRWLEFSGTNYKVNDELRAKNETSYKQKVEDGMPVGVKGLSIWNENSEAIKLRNEMIDKYYNLSPNAVRLYNESLVDSSIELQAEEPVCCQDLYAILDRLIQAVYTDKNADCAELIKQANIDFQKNYLDKLDY